MSIGWRHSCILYTNNYVKCFGDNEYGQLGVPITEYGGYTNIIIHQIKLHNYPHLLLLYPIIIMTNRNPMMDLSEFLLMLN